MCILNLGHLHGRQSLSRTRTRPSLELPLSLYNKACHEEFSSQAVTAIIRSTMKSRRRVEILSPISESVPCSGKPKECCGGVAVEQEKLQGLWVFAFGALTPVFCFLVLLTLNTRGSDVDIGCEIVV